VIETQDHSLGDLVLSLSAFLLRSFILSLIGVICGFSLTFNAARFNLRQHFVVNNSRANVVLILDFPMRPKRVIKFFGLRSITDEVARTGPFNTEK